MTLKHLRKHLSFLIISFISILTACSNPATQPSSPALPPTASGGQPTTGIDSSTAVTIPPGQAATEPPTAAAPLPEPVPLEIVDQGFSLANNDTVNYGFLVHNPNPSHAIQNSIFTATFFDANGAVLDTDEIGAIELVLPGQTMGVGDGLWLDNPVVASMSIELTSGEPVVLTESLPAYEITNSSICANPGAKALRAEITNPFAADVFLPRISVIYYNAAGKIVGAGSGYRGGLQANGKTGVLIWGYYSEDMDHFEVYPGYRGVPTLTSTLPSDVQPLKITASGYALNGSTLTYAVVIENPNSAYLVNQTVLAVNAYSADGKLLSGDPFRVISLLPGQKLGISRGINLCDGDVVDHIEVAIGSGDFTASGQTTYLTSENVILLDGAVGGDLVNQSGMEIKVVYATAIVYDENDQVIGGGFQTVDVIAAGGRASVQIPVVVNGTPARAELYAVLSPKSLPK